MNGLVEYVVAPLAALLPILLALGWYLSYVAVRLDRLHTQVEATAAAMDAQVVRRAEATVELAYGGDVDPASAALLLDAATRALADQGEWDVARCAAESELTEVLRIVLPGDDEPETAAAQPLVGAAERVRLARHFHNEVIERTLVLRRRRVVRALHLAGRTPMPEPVDLDDRWPQGA